ncbi:DUF2922 domain-containing protein [Bacillus sp. HMF5848]|uniref:DUF2922 domain-containing protein n=1 Tax=Bacillus sp. HMF5848 TaxID=2495421 RepID=UPI000F784498|nr:DUF2922 domain-containing protein [Bacillus sp. HMF5848]RSK25459.1 DUF2922 domain-containing protein [Bacillus sp. HMF5848]
MAKTLELQFLNEEGKTSRLTIEDPVEPIDTAAVATAMDTILMSSVFTSSGGDYIAKKGARLVERNVTDIPLQ